jgi:hypothetical protein
LTSKGALTSTLDALTFSLGALISFFASFGDLTSTLGALTSI